MGDETPEDKSILERQGALLRILEEAKAEQEKLNKRLDKIEKAIKEIRGKP